MRYPLFHCFSKFISVSVCCPVSAVLVCFLWCLAVDITHWITSKRRCSRVLIEGCKYPNCLKRHLTKKGLMSNAHWASSLFIASKGGLLVRKLQEFTRKIFAWRLLSKIKTKLGARHVDLAKKWICHTYLCAYDSVLQSVVIWTNECWFRLPNTLHL